MDNRDRAQRDGMYWGDNATATYYKPAAKDIERHWRTFVLPLIGDLHYTAAVDIAAGHGRNTHKLLKHASQVYCVDINPENIDYLRQEFGDDPRVTLLQTDGVSLRGIQDASLDLAYSFDSMVHFDVLVVAAYIDECFRVLRSGGHALLHFSNYAASPGADFRTNPHWRNYMSVSLFGHLAICAGFDVLSLYTIPWGDISELDGIALLQKPASS
jgi:ubiquinone/menaquinone biosynthesis C-methylase UbiE